MKLGIFGGTFDPIHMGHLLMAEQARQHLQLEQVLFVPTGEPPHKQFTASPTHRLLMTQQAIATNPHFTLSSVDIDRSGPNYSVDTIKLIRQTYNLPAEKTYFIIGADSLQDLPEWHAPRKLLTLCRLAVVHRPGYQPDLADLEKILPGLSEQIDGVPAPLMELASTDIRQQLAAGKTVRYQLPEVVLAYIEEHALYRSGG